ncbi:MAG: MBL fold metallo-hydrolase [Candidatus Didemnitutus sp.]|nr:MBL fold metallo-hydrolase [Candidatus Didemnitutus sp.]
MPVRFRILGSGSSGNAALLQSDDTRVLVDAGFSARKLNDLLVAAGESLARIDAIFLTHEHGDHAAGLSGLARYPHIKVFANHPTSQAVQRTLKHRVAWQVFETGATFRFREFEVSSFSVPHDAQDPVGFFIAHGTDDLFSKRHTLAWLTDLGHAPLHVHERVREADVLVVEANYCPLLLEADTRRPWSVKQRINGRHGHLSNEAARELLLAIASPRWRHVYFAHLSRDCNTPAAVELACAPALAALGCAFSVVAPGAGTPVFEF